VTLRPAALCQAYSDQASSHASILRRIAARLKKAEDDLAAVVKSIAIRLLLYARGCIIIQHHKM
jgi:hypothetical protein